MRLKSRPRKAGSGTPSERGFSLVEMMVSMLLGLFVLAGVAHTFLVSKRAYNTQQDLAQVQEGSRFALRFLGRDLRAGGYAGCTGFADVEVVPEPSADYRWNVARAVEGHEWVDGDWSPALPAVLDGRVARGTDVVVVRRLASNDALQARLVANAPGLSDELQVDRIAGLEAGAVAGVVDCTGGSIVEIAAVDATNNVLTHRGGRARAYGPGALVAPLMTDAYFIGSGRDGEPALLRGRASTDAGTASLSEEVLVAGAEDLQIVYGEDMSAGPTPERFVDASAVSNWSRVTGVRLALLMRGESRGPASGGRRYNLIGEKLAGPFSDGRVRQVASTTVALRNR